MDDDRPRSMGRLAVEDSVGAEGHCDSIRDSLLIVEIAVDPVNRYPKPWFSCVQRIIPRRRLARRRGGRGGHPGAVGDDRPGRLSLLALQRPPSEERHGNGVGDALFVVEVPGQPI